MSDDRHYHYHGLGSHSHHGLGSHSHQTSGPSATSGPVGALPGEVRTVDPVTGGEKGSKPIQLMPLLEMCPPAFLTDLGKLYAFGADKYAPDNWRKGYAWSLTFNALLRHLQLTLQGEWVDPESGLPHLVHVAWHCATLHTFEREHLGTDDRVHKP